jgi:hypothetical protein
MRLENYSKPKRAKPGKGVILEVVSIKQSTNKQLAPRDQAKNLKPCCRTSKTKLKSSQE